MMVFPYDETRLLAVLPGRPLARGRAAGGALGQRRVRRTHAVSLGGAGSPGARQRLVGLGGQTDAEQAGEPIDYITGGGVDRITHTAFDRNGIARVATRDPYAALLVSLHLTGLNEPGLGACPAHGRPPQEIPGVPEFMREQETLRTRLTDELRGTPTHAAYCADNHLWPNYVCSQLISHCSVRKGSLNGNRYPEY